MSFVFFASQASSLLETCGVVSSSNNTSLNLLFVILCDVVPHSSCLQTCRI